MMQNELKNCILGPSMCIHRYRLQECRYTVEVRPCGATCSESARHGQITEGRTRTTAKPSPDFYAFLHQQTNSRDNALMLHCRTWYPRASNPGPSVVVSRATSNCDPDTAVTLAMCGACGAARATTPNGKIPRPSLLLPRSPPSAAAAVVVGPYPAAF